MNKQKKRIWGTLAEPKIWRGIDRSIGSLQLFWLLNLGLRPEHFLLDLACGPLRAGVHFIFYLDKGHYYGVDADQRSLNNGEEYYKRFRLEDKEPNLVLEDNFDLGKLRRKFNFIIAQSLFTHLADPDIKKCLTEVDRILEGGGVFLATFFEAKKGVREVMRNLGTMRRSTFRNKNPFHQPFRFYKDNCPRALSVEYKAKWCHPRNLNILIFRKEKKKK